MGGEPGFVTQCAAITGIIRRNAKLIKTLGTATEPAGWLPLVFTWLATLNHHHLSCLETHQESSDRHTPTPTPWDICGSSPSHRISLKYFLFPFPQPLLGSFKNNSFQFPSKMDKNQLCNDNLVGSTSLLLSVSGYMVH